MQIIILLFVQPSHCRQTFTHRWAGAEMVHQTVLQGKMSAIARGQAEVLTHVINVIIDTTGGQLTVVFNTVAISLPELIQPE